MPFDRPSSRYMPSSEKIPQREKKGADVKPKKNWQEYYVPYSDEEEGSEDEEQQDMPRDEETLVPDDAEAQSTGNQTPGEETQTTLENLMDTSACRQEHKDDSSPGKGTQTALVIHEEAPTGGIKRGHESEKSDSDKEQHSNKKLEAVAGRQVAIVVPSQGLWVEVKNKRKGKKGKIEAYYQP